MAIASGSVALRLPQKEWHRCLLGRKHVWPKPTLRPGLSNVVQIAADAADTLALTSQGPEFLNGGAPVAVPAGLSNVVQVAAGSDHCFALKADGTVVRSGEHLYSHRTVGATAIAAGGGSAGHNLALNQDGTVTSWEWLRGAKLYPSASAITSLRFRRRK